MRRKTLAAGVTMVASLALALALSGVASAAPDNKNTGLLDVSCGEPIGNTTIELIDHGGTLSFWSEPSLPDQFHAVFKRGVLDGTDTLTIEGDPDPVFLHDAFTLPGGSGMGYEGRLVECRATITDEEDFKLTAHNEAILQFLGAPDLTQFIGAQVHRFTTGTFTFEVVVPG
jgi:hypothetical protein